MSTDSEDECSYLIKEAIDDSFLNEYKFKNCGDIGTGNTKPKHKKKLHSLLSEEENVKYRLFKVTPQYQNYVAKVLTNRLDEYIEMGVMEYSIQKNIKTKDSIKLLKTSASPIDVKKTDRDNMFMEASTYKHNSNCKRAKLKNIEHDLNVSYSKSVAISGEDILNFTGIKNWSSRSKAEVFRYVKNEKGILSSLE